MPYKIIRLIFFLNNFFNKKNKFEKPSLYPKINKLNNLATVPSVFVHQQEQQSSSCTPNKTKSFYCNLSSTSY